MGAKGASVGVEKSSSGSDDKKAKHSNLGSVLNLKNDVTFDYGDTANAVLVLLLRREIDELLAERIVDEGGDGGDDTARIEGQKYQQEIRRVVLGLIGK